MPLMLSESWMEERYVAAESERNCRNRGPPPSWGRRPRDDYCNRSPSPQRDLQEGEASLEAGAAAPPKSFLWDIFSWTRLLLFSLGLGLLLLVVVSVIGSQNSQLRRDLGTLRAALDNITSNTKDELQALISRGDSLQEKINSLKVEVDDHRQELLAGRGLSQNISSLESTVEKKEQQFKTGLSEITERVQELGKDLKALSCQLASLKNNGSAMACCPLHWVEHEDSCYWFSQSGKSWPDADKYCQLENAHLVVVNSMAEQDVQGKRTYGLQLADPIFSDFSNHNWKFKDSQLRRDLGTLKATSDNVTSNTKDELQALISRGDSLQEKINSLKVEVDDHRQELLAGRGLSQNISSLESTVEKKEQQFKTGLSEITERVQELGKDLKALSCQLASLKNNGSAMACCPLHWVEHEDSCYWFSQSGKSWPDADKYCQLENAHLVVVNSMAEQGRLSNMITWMGLTDQNGPWQWVDGTDFEKGFKHWAPEQPDNWYGHGLGGGEDCAHITSDGRWNDDVCHWVCETKLAKDS
ncbi:Macrophage asialoglycoprotein-binding protein [Cricetulus griseus]|uniref:Macrophage asialoglycoprotein-binding protein n=1 Tax=Cricetulus griseus TaxID=10029 RepID=G3GYA5_CRIGR|nr:Macrophage asialoglycoprotein-binding protein [Cricetulus griseus]